MSQKYTSIDFFQFQHKFRTEKACWKYLLGIKSYKTAWTMAHKVRKVMADRDARYQLADLVEMDDSYFGGSGRGRKGRGTEGKIAVLVAVENRGNKPGYLAMRVVDSLGKDRITHFAQTKIREGQDPITDMGLPRIWL